MFTNVATILSGVQPLSMTSPMENPDVVMPMSEFIRMNSTLNMVEPEKIYYKDKHTTVIWNDGTTTTVSCGESETFDKYSGFCAALAKKMFSSTTHVKRMIEQLDVEENKKKAAEARAKEKEEAKKAEEARRERARQRRIERGVKKEVERWMIERAADEIICNMIADEHDAEPVAEHDVAPVAEQAEDDA